MKTRKILIQTLIIAICASIAIASCSIGAVTEGIGDGTKDYVTVSFDSLGGNSPEEQKILSGTTVSEPLNMENGDLVFSGWYKEDTCDNCWNFDEPVTKDRTIYAKWNPADSLTFNLISGDTEYEVSLGSGNLDADLYIPAYYKGIPVTRIAEWAFYNCQGLTNVIISLGVVSIDYCAFTMASLQSVSLPSSLEIIESSAFSDSSLSNIEIPAGVTSISTWALSGCVNMDEISIDPGNGNYTVVDGVLFTKDLSYLHTYPAGKSGSSYTIASTVSEIGYGAFSSSSLVTVTIPPTVTTIHDSAFAVCSSLHSINIPTSVTSLGTRAFAFSFQDIASTIFIPSSVISIGLQEFWGCSNLSIYCEALSKSAGWADSWNQDNLPVFWNQTSAP